jgi:hypothetical protein
VKKLWLSAVGVIDVGWGSLEMATVVGADGCGGDEEEEGGDEEDWRSEISS